MPVPVAAYYDNAFMPGMTSEAYFPDQLIAGDLKIVTATVMVGGAAAYLRGTVLGVVTATGVYQIATSAATDGSQTPVAILVDNLDVTAGNLNGGIYQMGEFNQNSVILGTGMTLAAAKSALQAQNIYLKLPVSAADPT